LPTPNARDYKDGPYPAAMARRSPGLGTIVWATPTKSDGMGDPGNSGRDGGENLRTQVGGSLNPEWVTWLMGYPPGWVDTGTESPTSNESQSESRNESTSCEPSATASSPKSPSGSDVRSSNGKGLRPRDAPAA